jgi:vacuolar-type H+-ATPase subunit I/STV1
MARAPASAALRIVKVPGRTQLGPKQRRFNRLIKQAAERKRALAAWTRAQPDLRSQLAACEARLDEQRQVVANLVRTGAARLHEGGLPARERELLISLLRGTVRDLLDYLDDADLKQIYTRLSGRDFDTEAAAADALEARAMRAVLEMHGLEFDDADAASVEELKRATHAQLDELAQEAAAAAERRAKRKKSAKQVESEARKTAARTQIDKALQSVHRALVKALHPDREPDADERARKTQHMQEINAAYEAGDLLRLLELQLRFEQVDQAQIETLAEDRLEHFNALLAEQVGQLDRQVDEAEAMWRAHFDVPPTEPVLPARVAHTLGLQLEQAEDQIALARQDLAAFQDLAKLRVWLKAYARAR